MTAAGGNQQIGAGSDAASCSGKASAITGPDAPAHSGLTDERRTAYLRDGCVSVGSFLDATALTSLRAAVDAVPDAAGHDPAYGVIRHNVWRQIAAIDALIRDGQLAAIAAQALGEPDVVLFQDNLVWKTPGAARIEWHQDFSYWPLDGPRGVTQWLALDPADERNGCLHYLPGTHLLGERQPADFIVGTEQPPGQELPPLDWESREADAIAATTVAGELLLHDPLIWHMSPANVSTRQRRALSLTWVPASARWDPEHAPHPCNYELNPQPGTPLEGDRFPRFSVDIREPAQSESTPGDARCGSVPVEN